MSIICYGIVPLSRPIDWRFVSTESGTKKAWDDGFTAYFYRGIAKRLKGNKQPAPTPYRISIPLVGERIYDKHERLLTAYPTFQILAIFDRRIKQKRFLYVKAQETIVSKACANLRNIFQRITM